MLQAAQDIFNVAQHSTPEGNRRKEKKTTHKDLLLLTFDRNHNIYHLFYVHSPDKLTFNPAQNMQHENKIK